MCIGTGFWEMKVSVESFWTFVALDFTLDECLRILDIKAAFSFLESFCSFDLTDIFWLLADFDWIALVLILTFDLSELTTVVDLPERWGLSLILSMTSRLANVLANNWSWASCNNFCCSSSCWIFLIIASLANLSFSLCRLISSSTICSWTSYSLLISPGALICFLAGYSWIGDRENISKSREKRFQLHSHSHSHETPDVWELSKREDSNTRTQTQSGAEQSEKELLQKKATSRKTSIRHHRESSLHLKPKHTGLTNKSWISLRTLRP